MYETIKNAIHTENFDLMEMLTRIDILWIQESLTDQQRQELTELAQTAASIQTRADIFSKLEKHGDPVEAPDKAGTEES